MVEYITHTYHDSTNYDTHDEDFGALHRWINSICKHGWELFQVIPMEQRFSYQRPWRGTIDTHFLCVFKKVEIIEE